jgi:signal transduction histidine kinase
MVRVVRDGRVVAETTLARPLPRRHVRRSATVTTSETRWRSRIRQVDAGGVVQVAMPLDDAADLVARRGRRIVALVAGAGVGASAVTWWLTGAALAPLRRLRATAQRVAATRDLSSRTGLEQGPAEVRAVAVAVDRMLARLEHADEERERALTVSRQFAADAGHELRTPLTSIATNLDTLAQVPDLDPDERDALLAELRASHARLLRTLDGLQAWAVGDTRTVPDRPVDLADLADAAVAAVRGGDGPAIRLTVPDGPVTILGWDDGVRLLVDNLIDNARRHGAGEKGVVHVTVAVDGDDAVMVVEDDGPGIAPDERTRVFERFVRGAGAHTSGSGLGLALVAQQARLHSATVSVGTASLGGAAVVVRFPRLAPDDQRADASLSSSISSSSASS